MASPAAQAAFFRQSVPMEDFELERLLKAILSSITTKHFPWRLEGSANLRVLGVPTTVNDLDIVTNGDGLRIFKKCLENYGGKEVYNERKKINTLQYNISGLPVEIHCYDEYELRMLDKVVVVNWHGLTLPVLPLEYALQFYQRIHRLDKVKLIQQFLKEKEGKVYAV